MTRFLKYFRVQLKRSARFYPILLAFGLILAVCLTALLPAVLPKEEDRQTVRIALVGELDSRYLDLGITAMESLDSSRFYLELIPTTEKEALKLLRAGEILGYIDVPDRFVQSVIRGENLQLTFVGGNSPAALGPLLVREVLRIVSDYVTVSQNGIFGTLTIAQLEECSDAEYNRIVDEINLTYLTSLLSRADMVKAFEVGFGNQLDLANYYLCAVFILLLLLWGMICVPMLVRSSNALPALLHARGQSAFSQTLCEWIPFLLPIFLNGLLLFLALSFLPTEGLMLPRSPLDALATACGLLPAIMAVTALQFLICELFHGIISGTLAQLFFAVALAYVSGLIYPAYSLPLSVQALADLLPTGIAFDHTAHLLSGGGESAVLPALLCTALLLGGAALVRRLRIKGGKL